MFCISCSHQRYNELIPIAISLTTEKSLHLTFTWKLLRWKRKEFYRKNVVFVLIPYIYIYLMHVHWSSNLLQLVSIKINTYLLTYHRHLLQDNNTSIRTRHRLFRMITFTGPTVGWWGWLANGQSEGTWLKLIAIAHGVIVWSPSLSP